MSPWEERKKSLERLGFSSYESYLRSSLWAKVRRKRWARRDTLECRFCGRKPDQLHHEDYSYKTLKGEKLDALTPVCRDCHEYGSVGDSGQVLTPREARLRMKARAKANGWAPRGLLKPKRPRKKRPRKKRKRRGRGSGGVPRHPFEPRFGTMLCGFCDRSEEVHVEEQQQGQEVEARRKKWAAECQAALENLRERREQVPGGVERRQEERRKRKRRRPPRRRRRVAILKLRG